MAYEKTGWIDGITPLSALNLNKIENGIFNNDAESTIIDNKTGHCLAYKLETAGTTHRGGFHYTAFSGGAIIKGVEVYVARCAPAHLTSANNYGVIVAYIRDDNGTFTTRILPLDYTNQEYRDPNLTTHGGGKHLILTATGYDGTTYKPYYWLLDENLNVLDTKVVDSNSFMWGNALTTPSGHILKCGYSIASPSYVNLYRSTGNITSSSTDVGTFTKQTLMSVSNVTVNECTIGFWGNKIVAISRTSAVGMYYSETYDLEGLTGWSTPKLISLGFTVLAPCILPYTMYGDPLILTYTSLSTTNVRTTALTLSPDGTNWSSPCQITDSNGGYNTLVKTRLGYGYMYFDDPGNGTNLWFRDLDLRKITANYDFWKYQGNIKAPWVTVTAFQNSYYGYGSPYGGAIRYYKDNQGNVHLDGVATDGSTTVISSALTIFVLPIGFRPIYQQLISTISGSGIGAIEILQTGEVKHVIGSKNNCSLQNIIFTTL